MNCFSHNDRAAVGICKSCGKGLCPACAAQRMNGIACKGECEARVDLVNRIVDNNIQTLAAARYQTKSSGVLTLIVGVVFLGFAVVASRQDGWAMNAALFGCLGVVTSVLGIVRLNKKSQYPAPGK